MSKIHILDSRAINNLKRSARKLRKQEANISQAQALMLVANKVGFGSWKELIRTAKDETSYGVRNVDIRTLDTYEIHSHMDEAKQIISSNPELATQDINNTYTQDQKIGAISRKLGIKPDRQSNVIQFCIDHSDYMKDIDIPISELEEHGLCEDFELQGFLSKNDPFFAEDNEVFFPMMFFRVLNLDTDSHDVVDNYLVNVISKELNLFFGIRAEWIWINGALPPNTVPPYFEEEGDDDSCPILQLPPEAWRLYCQPARQDES